MQTRSRTRSMSSAASDSDAASVALSARRRTRALDPVPEATQTLRSAKKKGATKSAAKKKKEEEEEKEEQPKQDDSDEASDSGMEEEVEQNEKEESSDDEAEESSENEEEEGEDVFESMISNLEQKSKERKSKKEEKKEDQQEGEEREEEDDASSVSSEDADDEELALEEAVFGDLTTSTRLSDALSKVVSRKRDRTHLASSEDAQDALFFVDKDGVSETDDKKKKKTKGEEDKEESAWVDDDDKKVSVQLTKRKQTRKLRQQAEEDQIDGADFTNRLKAQRTKLVGSKAKWAEPKEQNSESDDEDGDDKEFKDLLRSSETLTKGTKFSEHIPPGKLLLSRLNDANQHSPSGAVVQASAWHKNGQLLLTAGFDKKLKVFQVDGKENALIESVYLRDMPIFSADFCGPSHEQILCSGRRPFFYWVDLESGKSGKIPGVQGRSERSFETMSVAQDGSLFSFLGYDGNILLLSQKTKQWVGNLKMNERGTCALFSEDGKFLYSSGNKGTLYVWDLRMNRLMHKFKDEGSICTRSIALSADLRRVAVGSTNGVVNLYETETVMESSNPTPLKSILNLTTAVDHLAFNHDGQLLAMMSRRKKDALRLFNVNTLSVVSNWPTASTPVHYGSSLAFSPLSDKLAIGNDRGKCLLYRLHHYSF